MIMLVFFTTAPEVYDLPGTVSEGHVGFTPDGRQIRAVRVDVAGSVPQVRRYLSAGYFALDGAQLRVAEVYLEARAEALIDEGLEDLSLDNSAV